MKIIIPHDFTPRHYQVPLMRYLDNGGKRAACVWHRRAGKDQVMLNQANKLAHERKALYWHMLPTYRQAKKALWDGFRADGKRIIDTVFPPAIVKRKNESEMLIELRCGSIIQLVGSDTVDNLVGAGPAGVTFSEYSISKPKAWNLIRPMLAENGGWAAFIFTPRGNNHGKQLFDMARSEAGQKAGWFAELLTIHDTRALPADILDEERAAGMPEALIRQEYLCDFTAANVGSVWGDLLEQLEKRGGMEAFEHERDGVSVWFDLGISDSTSMWLARMGDGGLDFIDHHEAHNKPMSYFFDWLDMRAATMGYRYRKFWLPHDGRARTLATGVSILDLFHEQCRKGRWGSAQVDIGPSLSLPDGIQAGRWLLQQNTRFHPRCAEGIEALRQYHYEFDEDRKTFGSRPEHDWASHSADGFRYAAIVARTEIEAAKRLAAARGPAAPAVRSMASLGTLNELWAANARGSGRQRGRI